MPNIESTSGIRWATLKDMQGEEYREIFKVLENYQARFFAMQHLVNTGPYKWPLQPLYEWSRRVEYPFVVSQLRSGRGRRVLDAGSGVTFFPLYLGEALGYDVQCLDKEPVYASRMMRMCERMGIESGVPFHIGDLTKGLPLQDQIFDAVLCISVLEHLPPELRLMALQELWRLVAPGGQLIMTFDVSLTGEEDGVLLFDVGDFVSELARIVGPVPALPRYLPPDLLTPQHPGYGFAPVKSGNSGPLIRLGPERWLFRLLRRQIVFLKPIACLLFCVTKPATESFSNAAIR